MWTPQKAANGSQNGSALGWSTDKEAGVASVGHGGSQQGTSTSILLAPDERAGMLVFINLDDVNASALARDLLKIVLGESRGDRGSPSPRPPGTPRQ